MANLSKSLLKQESNNTYIDNNAEAITPAGVRSFNNDLIDSLASQDEFINLSGSYLILSQSHEVVSASVASFTSVTYVSASQTSSMIVSQSLISDYAITASYALNGGSGGQVIDSGAFVTTTSFGEFTQSLDKYAITGSNTFVGDQTINGNVTINGTASVSTLIAYTVSSSIVYSSGSNKFGNSLTDSQALTGSVGVRGTFKVDGYSELSGSFSGSLNGTASYSSYASESVSSSYSVTTSYFDLSTTTANLNLQTGILKGGILSASIGSNKFQLSAGYGHFVSYSVEGPAQLKTTANVVSWSLQTNIDLDYLTTSPITYLYIDRSGVLYQQTSSFTSDDVVTKLIVGSITHADNQYIDSVEGNQVTAYNSGLKADQLIMMNGVIKEYGLQPFGISGSLQIGINSGSVFHAGVDYKDNPFESYQKNVGLVPTASFTRVYKTGSGFEFDNNNTGFGPSFYDAIDPTKYVDVNGNLLSVNSKFSVQRIFQHPDNPSRLFVYYGNKTYNTLDDAVNGIIYENFEESVATEFNTTFIGYLVLSGNSTDLSDPVNAVFVYAGKQRGLFSAGGLSVTVAQDSSTGFTQLFTATTTASIQHGLGTYYPLVSAWRSGSTATDLVIPESVKVVDANNIVVYFSTPIDSAITVAKGGAPFTASYSDVSKLDTASFNSWTGSISSQFSGSASYALTASYALNVPVTASYALTASYVLGQSPSASWASASLTASYVLNAVSSSYAETASYILTASYALRSEVAVSSSFATYSVNAGYATASLSSSYVETASYANVAALAINAISSSWASASLTASYILTASYALRAGSSDSSLSSSWASASLTASVANVAGYAYTASYVDIARTASFVTGGNVYGAVSQSYSASLAETASFALRSISASYLSGSTAIVENVVVYGTASVKYLITEYETASVIYSSGSNKFGDEQIDVHQFTGSVAITGSLYVDKFLTVTEIITGSIVTALTASYIETASYALTASYVINALTASYISGSNVSGTVSSSYTSSVSLLAYTASQSLNAYTASFVTGSNVVGIVSTAYTSSIALLSYTSSYISGSNVKGTVDSAYTSSVSLLAYTASYVLGNNVRGAVTSSLTASYVSGAVLNYPDAFTSTAVVTNIVTLTVAEYAALLTKDSNTLYITV